MTRPAAVLTAEDYRKIPTSVLLAMAVNATPESLTRPLIAAVLTERGREVPEYRDWRSRLAQ